MRIKKQSICIFFLVVILFYILLVPLDLWHDSNIQESGLYKQFYLKSSYETILKPKQTVLVDTLDPCLTLYAVLIVEPLLEGNNLSFKHLSILLDFSVDSFHVDNFAMACGLPMVFCPFVSKSQCSRNAIKTFSHISFNQKSYPTNIDVLASFESELLKLNLMQNNFTSRKAISWQLSNEKNVGKLLYSDLVHLISSYHQLFYENKFATLLDCNIISFKILGVTFKLLDSSPIQSKMQVVLIDSNTKKKQLQRFARVKRTALKPSKVHSFESVSAVPIPSLHSIITPTHTISASTLMSKGSQIYNLPPLKTVDKFFMVSLSERPLRHQSSTSSSVAIASSASGSGHSGSGELYAGSGSQHLDSHSTTNIADTAFSMVRTGNYSLPKTSWFSFSTHQSDTTASFIQPSGTSSYENLNTIFNAFTELQSSKGVEVSSYSTSSSIPSLPLYRVPTKMASSFQLDKVTTTDVDHLTISTLQSTNRRLSLSSKVNKTTNRFSSLTSLTQQSKSEIFTTFLSHLQTSDLHHTTASTPTTTPPLITSERSGPLAASTTGVYGKRFVFDIPNHWKAHIRNGEASVELSQSDLWLGYSSKLMQLVGVPLINTDKPFELLINLVYKKEERSIQWPTAVLLNFRIYTKSLSLRPSYLVQTNCSIKMNLERNSTKNGLLGLYAALFINKMATLLPHVNAEDVSVLRILEHGISDHEMPKEMDPKFQVTWFVEKFDSRTFLKHFKPILVDPTDNSGTKQLFFELLPEFILESVMVTPLNDNNRDWLPGTTAHTSADLSIILPVAFISFFLVISMLTLIIRYHRKNKRFNKSALIDRTFAKRRKPIYLREEMEMDRFQPSKPRILSSDIRRPASDSQQAPDNRSFSNSSFNRFEPSTSSSEGITFCEPSSAHRSPEEFDRETGGTYSFVNSCFMDNDEDATSLGSDMNASFVYDNRLLSKKGD